jgi:hypothetical protein
MKTSLGGAVQNNSGSPEVALTETGIPGLQESGAEEDLSTGRHGRDCEAIQLIRPVPVQSGRLVSCSITLADPHPLLRFPPAPGTGYGPRLSRLAEAIHQHTPWLGSGMHYCQGLCLDPDLMVFPGPGLSQTRDFRSIVAGTGDILAAGSQNKTQH